MNIYSTWQADSHFESGKRCTLLSPVLHGSFASVKHYFLRRGVLTGIDGLTICLTIAFGSYSKYAKVLEGRGQV